MARYLAALCLTVASIGAFAQVYPARPVKVVVPYPAGSTPDLLGRTLAERLHNALGQPFLVENRSGAGGSLGAEAVAKAPADGYTLLIGGNGPVVINKYLYKELGYDPDRDFVPISLLAVAPQLLVARPEVGAADLKAFLDGARRQPGKLSYASVGAGSASHLTMEMLKGETGVNLTHVPYRGFPAALTDMLGGNVDAMFAIVPAVLPQVRAGKLKALAITARERSSLCPEVPSVTELGFPTLESLAWNGLLAPSATPADVVARLSSETMRAMRDSQARDALKNAGFDVVAGTPDEFSRWIRSESVKWAAVVRASGARAD